MSNLYSELYGVAADLCWQAVNCSDGSTEYERRAIERIKSVTMPSLNRSVELTKRMTSQSATDPQFVQCLTESVEAFNEVLAALDGSTALETSVMAQASDLLDEMYASLSKMGIRANLRKASYGNPFDFRKAIISAGPPVSSSQGSTSSGGCYVATAAYGSYDCPQVWVLRRYRDNKLATSPAGRAFIKFYYAVSPTLVRYFGKFDLINAVDRFWLNRVISRLRRAGYSADPYKD